MMMHTEAKEDTSGDVRVRGCAADGMRIAPPHTRSVGDGTRRELTQDYTIRVSLWPFRVSVTVRAGFVYDGASVPRALWGVIGDPWAAIRLPAATAHDALYAAQTTGRLFADAVYYLALTQAGGMPRLYALAETLAIRRGGRAAWAEKTDAQREAARRLVSVEFGISGRAPVGRPPLEGQTEEERHGSGT